jgi:hypothetical protein
MPSIVFSPGEATGFGKVERASRKGGILSSEGEPLPGLIDRIPTMMMGTIRPSGLSSSLSVPLPRLLVLNPSFLRFVPDPNLNIRKKLSGAGFVPGVSEPSPFSLLLCLKADAILPFCRAWRKLSNVPSSPSPAMLRASETAW